MEGSDAFTQGSEIGQDVDPFAGSDFGDLDLSQPSGPASSEEAPAPDAEPVAAAEPEEALPVVDREGEPVEVKPEPTAEAEPAPAADVEQKQPIEPDPAPMPDVTEPVADEVAEPPAPEVAADPTLELETAAEPVAQDEQRGEPEEAPVPEEVVKDGKTTHRRYIVLIPDGPNSFKRVHWYEDKDKKMVRRTDPGAKKQTVALARDQESALRIGYAAVGAPQEGAALIAVAESSFQVRTVQPDIPQPSRQRLKIS